MYQIIAHLVYDILMKRYYVIFRGRVQGVGFRYTAQMYAERNNCTGWVRNLSNGDVDMEIQGSEADCLKAIRDINNNNSRWIRIDDYFMKEKPVDPSEKRFRSLYESMYY